MGFRFHFLFFGFCLHCVLCQALPPLPCCCLHPLCVISNNKKINKRGLYRTVDVFIPLYIRISHSTAVYGARMRWAHQSWLNNISCFEEVSEVCACSLEAAEFSFEHEQCVFVYVCVCDVLKWTQLKNSFQLQSCGFVPLPSCTSGVHYVWRHFVIFFFFPPLIVESTDVKRPLKHDIATSAFSRSDKVSKSLSMRSRQILGASLSQYPTIQRIDIPDMVYCYHMESK